MPGLPLPPLPPPLLEADRRYKRPGRAPAVAPVGAGAHAVGSRGGGLKQQRGGQSGGGGGEAGARQRQRQRQRGGSPWATPMRGLSAAALCWSYGSAEGSFRTAGWAGLQRCRSL